MMATLTMNSNVLWPMFNAWAAICWLPLSSPAEIFSCIPPRLAMPKRSSTPVTHCGSASRLC
ncbi:Uncharacterised protein [Mycobacterium tuberculosis]|nr:Uncharacterised protein [Mycobacterium tuberculosis]